MAINDNVHNSRDSTPQEKIDKELETRIEECFEEVQTSFEERRKSLTLTLTRNAQLYYIVFPDSIEIALKNPEFNQYKYNPLALWHRLMRAALRLNKEKGYNLNIILKEKPALLFGIILKEYAEHRQIPLEDLRRSQLRITVMHNKENDREEYFFKVEANNKDPIKIKYKYTGISKHNMREKLLREADYLRSNGYSLLFLFEKHK